jgi:hypothetical protein
MFERFADKFTLTEGRRGRLIDGDPREVLARQFGGCTFDGGLYRVHTSVSAAAATQFVVDAFPEFQTRAMCFAFDWLGRQFATDSARGVASDPEVLMFEPGTGQVLEIPVPFSDFHDEELVAYTDEALASGFFAAWMTTHGSALGFNECVGYRTPLFLGGSDDVANLEISDIDVYWTIMGQLRLKALNLPAWTAITSVRSDDR